MSERPVAIRTEGQRLLLDVTDAPSAIATKIGAAKAQVSQWRRGHPGPTAGWRAALLASYRIPVEAWDALPNASDAPGTAEAPAGVSAQPSTSPLLSAAPTGSLAEVNAHLARIRSDLDTIKLTSTERSRLSDVYTRALAVKARLEREAEMLEDRIVRDHPAWKRLRAAILEALRPYPEAALAVMGQTGPERGTPQTV